MFGIFAVNGTTPILLTFSIIFAIIWLVHHYSWWRIQDVRYIMPNPILEFLFIRKSAPLHISEDTSYKTLKRTYGRYDGLLPVLTVGDVRDLENVFLKDFPVFQTRRDMKFNCPIMDKTLFGLRNPDWKRVRKVVARTFTTVRIKTMLDVLEGSCDYLINNLTESNNTSGKVNCQKEFEKFVLHAIGTCAFGMDMSGLDDPDNEFVKHSRNLFKQPPGNWKTNLITKIPQLVKLFRIKLLNAESTDFFRATIIKAIEERKNTDVNRKDFLQMILDADNDVNNDDAAKLDINNNENWDATSPVDETLKKNEKGLTHDEVLSQCATFFMAGSESTSSLLSNVMFHLTKNKECQERVYNEILERDTSKSLLENLNKMKYLEGVINESLRMVPAMVRLERSCHQDYAMKCEDESEYIQLKKGMLVNIPTYAIHHNEEYYPQPEKFLPERFLKNHERTEGMSSVTLPPKYAFHGFGEGQRKCVAFRFVYIWTKLCLYRILEKFELVECDSTAESLNITENLGLLRIPAVEVALRPRSSAE